MSKEESKEISKNHSKNLRKFQKAINMTKTLKKIKKPHEKLDCFCEGVSTKPQIEINYHASLYHHLGYNEFLYATIQTLHSFNILYRFSIKYYVTHSWIM